MKLKINWKDPKFAGLSKKQIKTYCKEEAEGKSPKIPKPQLSKRMNRKIKKLKFIEGVKDPTKVSRNAKATLNQKLISHQSEEKVKIKSKKEVALEKAENGVKVFFDASFEGKHNKKALTALLCEFAQISAIQMKSDQPLQIHIHGIGKKTQRLLAKKLAMKWALVFHEQPIEKAVNVEDMVYLSPDAEEEISEFDPK